MAITRMQKKTWRKRVTAKAGRRAIATLKRNVRSNVVSLKRATLTQGATGTLLQFNCGVAWSFQQYAFRLADLPNSTEFTNLFTQYRVNALKYTFVPVVTEVDGVNFAQSQNLLYVTQPRLYTVIDRAGNASIQSELAMLQYSAKRQITKPLETFSIYVKTPMAQLLADGTAVVGSGSQLSGRKWMDVVNTDVIFSGCGIGGVQPYVQGNTGIVYNVVCTAYLQFRGAR